MRRRVRIVAALAGLGLLFGFGLVVKAGLEVNDWIDRCVDDGARSYIDDIDAREAACATYP